MRRDIISSLLIIVWQLPYPSKRRVTAIGLKLMFFSVLISMVTLVPMLYLNLTLFSYLNKYKNSFIHNFHIGKPNCCLQADFIPRRQLRMTVQDIKFKFFGVILKLTLL